MTRQRKHSPIGIDIGETGVRAAQVVCVGGRYTVESVARCERPHLREGGSVPPASPGAPGRGLSKVGQDPPYFSNCDDAEWSTALAGCLQRCLRQSAFHGHTATAALDAPDVEFHALELPEAVLGGDPEGGSMTHPTRGKASGDAASVVGFEVQRLLTDLREAVEIRHWTLPTTKASAPNTIGMAAPRTILAQRLAAFERAGMRCTRVDAAAAALCRLGCLLGRFGTDEVWGVLDLGARQTRLLLCVDETPVLVRTAGPGGVAWTGRIADALEISARAAEVQKCDYGIARSSRGVRSPASGSTIASGSTLSPTSSKVGLDPPYCRTTSPDAPGHSVTPSFVENGECGMVNAEKGPHSAFRVPHSPQSAIGSILFGILRGDLNELAAEVKRSYEYVLSCYPPRTASDLILLGGGTGMQNLPEFLSDALGIPVRRASNFVRGESSRLLCDDACAETIDSLGLAVGLAIGQ